MALRTIDSTMAIFRNAVIVTTSRGTTDSSPSAKARATGSIFIMARNGFFAGGSRRGCRLEREDGHAHAAVHVDQLALADGAAVAADGDRTAQVAAQVEDV